jgi:hypothetical protein
LCTPRHASRILPDTLGVLKLFLLDLQPLGVSNELMPSTFTPHFAPRR